MLWVQKNTSNEGLVLVAREFFVNGFWQLDPKPPNRMSDTATSKIDKYFIRVVPGTKCLTRATTPTVLLTFNATLLIRNFQLKLLSNRTTKIFNMVSTLKGIVGIWVQLSIISVLTE